MARQASYSASAARRLAQEWSRLSLSAMIGFAVTGLFLVVAIGAPVLAPYGISDVVGGVWEPSSAGHWLGTDNLGRDLLSRLIWGAQLTLLVPLTATVLAIGLGTALGFTAAFFGGWVDQALSRANDVVMSIPTLILALVVLSVLPSEIYTLVLLIAVLEATRVYRIARSVAMEIVVLDYVEVARLRGEGWRWIMMRELLPNAAVPLMAEFGVRFVFAILFLSALSYLGLGVQPPLADWGGIVRDNKEGIIFGVGAALYPGVAITILAISVNLIVDWFLERTTGSPAGS